MKTLEKLSEDEELLLFTCLDFGGRAGTSVYNFRFEWSSKHFSEDERSTPNRENNSIIEIHCVSWTYLNHDHSHLLARVFVEL